MGNWISTPTLFQLIYQNDPVAVREYLTTCSPIAGPSPYFRAALNAKHDYPNALIFWTYNQNKFRYDSWATIVTLLIKHDWSLNDVVINNMPLVFAIANTDLIFTFDVFTSLRAARYDFSVKHPKTFQTVDSFYRGKVINSYCMNPEYDNNHKTLRAWVVESIVDNTNKMSQNAAAMREKQKAEKKAADEKEAAAREIMQQQRELDIRWVDSNVVGQRLASHPLSEGPCEFFQQALLRTSADHAQFGYDVAKIIILLIEHQWSPTQSLNDVIINDLPLVFAIADTNLILTFDIFTSLRTAHYDFSVKHPITLQSVDAFYREKARDRAIYVYGEKADILKNWVKDCAEAIKVAKKQQNLRDEEIKKAVRAREQTERDLKKAVDSAKKASDRAEKAARDADKSAQRAREHAQKADKNTEKRHGRDEDKRNNGSSKRARTMPRDDVNQQ